MPRVLLVGARCTQEVDALRISASFREAVPGKDGAHEIRLDEVELAEHTHVQLRAFV